MVGGVHREFRRPIGIVNPAFRLRNAGHGFAAQTHVIHVQSCILPKKLSELGGVAAAGDAARRQEFAHRKHILPDFLRNDEQFSAYRQHRIQVLHRRVEGEGGVDGDPAFLRQPPVLPAIRLSSVSRQCFRMNCTRLDSALCRITTPLGCPVVPEV